MGLVDLYLVYQFLKRLATPFEKWDAYEMGVIDKNGNALKDRGDLTSQEKKVWGRFDVIIANLKKLLAKVPGGRTMVGSYAAALLLLKEHEENYLTNCDDVAVALREEIANVQANIAGARDGDEPPGPRKRKNTTHILRRKYLIKQPTQVV